MIAVAVARVRGSRNTVLRRARAAANVANRRFTPRRTGALQRSMEVVLDGSLITIVWTIEYAAFVNARRRFARRVRQYVLDRLLEVQSHGQLVEAARAR